MKEYYLADADGFLRSTLYLSDEEVPHYTGLLTERPAERPAPQVASTQLSESDVLEILWARVRTRRNKLLADSDWVVVRASDRGEPVPPEWQTYRQALRDVTSQPDPFNIVWPTPPA